MYKLVKRQYVREALTKHTHTTLLYAKQTTTNKMIPKIEERTCLTFSLKHTRVAHTGCFSHPRLTLERSFDTRSTHDALTIHTLYW